MDLDQIKARAEGLQAFSADVLALVARVQVLEATGRLEILRDLRTRAEVAEAHADEAYVVLGRVQTELTKAEARVRELEVRLAGLDDSPNRLPRKT